MLSFKYRCILEEFHPSSNSCSNLNLLWIISFHKFGRQRLPVGQSNLICLFRSSVEFVSKVTVFHLNHRSLSTSFNKREISVNFSLTHPRWRRIFSLRRISFGSSRLTNLVDTIYQIRLECLPFFISIIVRREHCSLRMNFHQFFFESFMLKENFSLRKISFGSSRLRFRSTPFTNRSIESRLFLPIFRRIRLETLTFSSQSSFVENIVHWRWTSINSSLSHSCWRRFSLFNESPLNHLVLWCSTWDIILQIITWSIRPMSLPITSFWH